MPKARSRVTLILILVAVMTAAHVSAGARSVVLPLDAKVESRGYPELSADWWKWAYAQLIPPYVDPDGRFCDLGQAGPVWFLAGTDGSFDASRSCTVPKGKYLFLPVINMIHIARRTATNQRAENCRRMQESAAVNNDKLISAVVFIDDVQIEDVARYRVRSKGCFDPFGADPSDRESLETVAASDGYWLLIAPLPGGRHTIRIGANYGAKDEPYGHMIQNFEYEIWVGEEGRITSSSPDGLESTRAGSHS